MYGLYYVHPSKVVSNDCITGCCRKFKTFSTPYQNGHRRVLSERLTYPRVQYACTRTCVSGYMVSGERGGFVQGEKTAPMSKLYGEFPWLSSIMAFSMSSSLSKSRQRSHGHRTKSTILNGTEDLRLVLDDAQHLLSWESLQPMDIKSLGINLVRTDWIRARDVSFCGLHYTPDIAW